MKTSLLLLAIIFALTLGFSSCANYSTPDLDAQGRLNERYKKGEISREQYEQELHRQREQPWGNTGEPKPPRDHFSF